MASDRRWELDGDEIAPGRTALRRLGGGGEYEVYLVWDDGLGAKAAAKLVRPDRLDNPNHARRLAREAIMLERLGHPGLPRLLDRHLDGAMPHILLEHLDGPALHHVIKQHGRLRPEHVPRVGLELAGVLQFFAARGHVHLDVKPSNVVLVGIAKLIDLSLTRPIEVASRPTRPIGTPGYLAPEQCLGDEIGSPSDVWGLGATLYEAAEGARPFRKLAWKEVASAEYPQVREAPAPFTVAIDPALATLVLACLDKDPASRPTAAEVMSALH